MANMTRSKEYTAGMRALLKEKKIDCHARAIDAHYIRISAPAYEMPFSLEDRKTIKEAAISLGMIGVRGTPIDTSVAGDPLNLFFWIP